MIIAFQTAGENFKSFLFDSFPVQRQKETYTINSFFFGLDKNTFYFVVSLLTSTINFKSQGKTGWQERTFPPLSAFQSIHTNENLGEDDERCAQCERQPHTRTRVSCKFALLPLGNIFRLLMWKKPAEQKLSMY